MLLQAWPLAGLSAPSTALVLVGDGPIRARAVAAGAAHLEGPLPPERLRNFYAGSDVVVVPSIPTRDFLEPWGLVVNEAFDQGVPVIATDAVGAAAGGLVQHERTGLVVPAGDERALAAALRRLHDDPALRARLGANAREAVRGALPRRLGGGHERGAAGRGSVQCPLLAFFGCFASHWRAWCWGSSSPSPAANAASTTQILRDCADDGVLQGDYSPSELRKARQNIPTDTDEYTDCRDVLARAAAAAAARSAAPAAAARGGTGGAAGAAAARGPGHARRAATDRRRRGGRQGRAAAAR